MAAIATITAMSIKTDQQQKPKKRVWFPVDKNGEPHIKNPDDGFGGAKFSLTQTKMKYFYDKNGKILEGVEAHVAAREETLGKNWRETCNIIRTILVTDIESFKKLETEIHQLDDPWLAQLGAVWRSNFGRRKRIEE